METIIRIFTFAVATTALALGSPVAANDGHEQDIIDTVAAAGSVTTLAAAGDAA